MPLLDKMERRFGFLSIPGLIRYIAILQLLVYVVLRANPAYGEVLSLDGGKILSGEVWRLVTCLFIPEASNPLFFLIAAMFMLFVANSLEELMGAFRLTLYVLVFLVSQWVAAFVPFPIIPLTYMFSTNLFFALALLAPRLPISIYFIFPIEIRWLALINAGFLVFSCLQQPLLWPSMIWSLLAFFLLAVPMFARSLRAQARVTVRRAEFKSNSLNDAVVFHTCSVCGKTDLSHPDTEFRITDDGEEFCDEHILNAG